MKKTIAIATGGLQFNGDTIKDTALGGSESAVIYMARELAKLNNDVTVYCHCDKPGIYDNVDYRNLDNYFNDDKSQFDVLIISRFTDLLAQSLDSKLNILWCHDIGVENMNYALGTIDRIFCLSQYHKDLYKNQYNIQPSDYIWKTSNGYDQTIPSKNLDYNQKKNNYIYASRPERGLKLLLEKIWPRIVQNNPDAILNLCGYTNSLPLSEDVQVIHNEIKELLKDSKNVKIHGSLNKQNYYELLQTCAYMVYPSDFPEISCINAIEAQYNNCLVITSDEFALSETVKTDTKINQKYGSEEYIEEFLALIDHYKDDNYITTNVEEYSWENVAKSWNTEIDNMFITRHNNNKDKILQQLAYNSDIVAAYKLSNDEKYKILLEKAAIDNTTKSDFYPVKKDEDYFLSNRNLKLIELVEKENRPLKILDLGSNEGILSLPLLKRFSDKITELTMFDSSKDVLDFVKDCYQEKYPQLKFINDNVLNVLNYDLKPDIVIVGELLEHIEDTQQFLNFLMNLADDTIFYFTVPHGPWEAISKSTDIHHVHHFEKKDIETIFKNTNITIAKNTNIVHGLRQEPCSHWMFWFKASKSDNIVFEHVDYQDKFIKTRPYKSVSVCLITKNEEDNISRCLKSVYSIADEIIVVDTGSIDDTKYIASKFTNNVYDLKWEEDDGLGNFAMARNYAVEKASGDYIFYIDADEELENGNTIFKFIISDYYNGVQVNQQQVQTIHSTKVNFYHDIMQDRLFKKDGIRFTGVIHEYPSKDGEKFLDNVLCQHNAQILHYGFANRGKTSNKTMGRNTALIYKNVRTYPDRPFAKYYILVDYFNQLVSSNNTGYVSDGYEYYIEHLKYCDDAWIMGMSAQIIQLIYQWCAERNVPVLGKELSYQAFEINDSERLDFFVRNPDEVDYFLKYYRK
jgi:glycosyltransferase involved in cell wall biosynthesis/2-polyprenyl-3-methyl-5-hydroxy-6-metoxy-1,4-benzoquinol methylase